MQEKEVTSEPVSESAVCIEGVGRFRFDTPLWFDREAYGDGIVLSDDDHNLYCTGASMEDALKDLEESLDDLWEEYIDCDESGLESSGLRFREWLRSNIRADGG